MNLKHLIAILLLVSGCQSTSSIGSHPLEAKSVPSSFDVASFAKQEPLPSESISPNMVLDDTFRKNGFPVSQETVTNLSSQSMVIRLTVFSSTYKLLTRIHEQVAMSALALTNLNREYWKISSLELTLSELLIMHGNGTLESLQLGTEGARFDLVPGEVAKIKWIARLPADTQICPFYSSLYMGSFDNYSVRLNWNFAGESLQGTLTRSIEGILQNHDGTETILPIVTKLPSAIIAASSDWSPEVNDRDFGCNGFMQVMN